MATKPETQEERLAREQVAARAATETKTEREARTVRTAQGMETPADRELREYVARKTEPTTPPHTLPWKQLGVKAKAKWPKLTDADLKEINGDRNALAAKVFAYYPRDLGEANKDVNEFYAANRVA